MRIVGNGRTAVIAVIAAAFATAFAACGGSNLEQPEPLSVRFDDMHIAAVPIEEKQAIFEANNGWSVAKAERAAYATFGTQELSDAIIAALAGRCACLMGHHGMVVFGRDCDQALALAVELETLCEQYWRVLQLGKPRLLGTAEMKRVLAKFAAYGQQD